MKILTMMNFPHYDDTLMKQAGAELDQAQHSLGLLGSIYLGGGASDQCKVCLFQLPYTLQQFVYVEFGLNLLP